MSFGNRRTAAGTSSWFVECITISQIRQNNQIIRDMEKEYVSAVAQEISDVLNLCCGITMSWGLRDRRATLYKGMPALRFSVNGFVHKGDVVVALNEGQDLYECYLIGKDGNVTREFKEVYVDMLIGILDKAVETGGRTEEEYKEKVAEWLETSTL